MPTTTPNAPPVARRKPATVLAVLIIAAASLGASTASANDGIGSMRAAGMGSVFVGGATANGAIFLNPAGLASVPLYSIEAGYDIGLQDKVSRVSASIADSLTNSSIAAGFAYSYSFSRGEEDGRSDDRRDHDIRLSTAIPLMADKLTVGTTLRYLHHTDGRNAEDEPNRTKGFTFDLGIQGRLSENLAVGITTRNIVHVRRTQEGREVAMGLGLYLSSLHLETVWNIDVDSHPDVEHTLGLGAEFMFQSVTFRAGYTWDSFNTESRMSVGFGYRSDSFGLDMAFRQLLDTADDRYFGVTALLFL